MFQPFFGVSHLRWENSGTKRQSPKTWALLDNTTGIPYYL